MAIYGIKALESDELFSRIDVIFCVSLRGLKSLDQSLYDT